MKTCKANTFFSSFTEGSKRILTNLLMVASTCHSNLWGLVNVLCSLGDRAHNPKINNSTTFPKILECDNIYKVGLFMADGRTLKEVCWWGHMTMIRQIYEILPQIACFSRLK